MRCIDCREPILESEARAFCCACKGRLHAECAMSSIHENDICEDCYIKEQAAEYALEHESEVGGDA